LESWSYYAIEPVAVRMQKARAAAGGAFRLQPDLAEAHLALGLIYYISLDPKDPILLENMGWNYLAARDYAKARKVFDRAVEVAPDTFTIRELRARMEFCDKGDLRPMQQLLASWPENVDPNGTITLTRYNYHLYQRNYAELIGVLERSPAQKSRGETSAPISKSYLLATVYALLKDKAKARAKFEEGRLQAEAAVRESPEDGPRHALLGLIYAANPGWPNR
jgi:tetratricopeptide (TPR) repeat protein